MSLKTHNILYCLISDYPSYGFPFCRILRLTAEVKLRPKVSRPVRLGVRHTSGTRDQFFFLLEIFFGQLQVCYSVAPSLTRGRDCNLLLLLVLDSAVPLGSDSRGTQDHILLSQFLRPLQPGGPVPRIYTRWPSYTPGHWVLFCVQSHDTLGYGGGIVSRLHTGLLLAGNTVRAF
jgi:hypothetical protein